MHNNNVDYESRAEVIPRLQLLNLDPVEDKSTLAEDVLTGLSRTQKELPPKYFYDEYGSWLFDRICEVPEYYPTRTENALLERYAREIISLVRPDTILELGSGASRKTVHLLDACEHENCLSLYQPLDVCGEMLVDAGRRLMQNYSWLDIEALVGEYDAGLDYFSSIDGNSLYVFLGGSIGNFTDDEARGFLRQVRSSMSSKDYLLLGADRVKDPSVLNAAYNDADGYTEAFNLNMLSVINRELGGTFDPERFRHRAFFNEEQSQIEMHLQSVVDQRVEIDGLGRSFSFTEGESIRTEISRKFTPESLAALVNGSGFQLARHFQPENGYFSLVLLTPGD